LASFEKTLADKKEKLKKYERRELILFEAKIHEEAGSHDKAIKILNDKKGHIVDDVNKYESLARNYKKLGDKDHAIEALDTLLEINSSNYNYYYRVLEAHGIKIPAKVTDKLT
jgi:predicted Zn-dependent protease